MLTDETKKKINTARDILVGVVPVPTSQVEQITLALIYKFMSDLDKKAKDLGDTSGFFANGYEEYSWDHLMDKSLGARERVKLYSEGLEKMSLNPHIPQLFRDIFKNAFLRFNNPETLKMFLDTIDQFEYDHSEELGNAFEYLLQVMGSQGDAGQFRTPRHIIDFIVEVVEPKKTDKILDPACGTAGFLISAYKYLRRNGLGSDEVKELSDNFVGYDISSDMQRLSLVNMYLHNFPDPHIYEYDTLTSEERWDDDFDVILANPPFMTPKGGIKPHSRFSVRSKRAEVLFVDYIMEHLTNRGKAAVIVPEGVIFQSQNAYKDLRKMMVDEKFLWAVVSLPSGVFQPYSGVKTSILLFDKEIAKKTNKILFVNVENDGFDLGAQRKPVKENDLPVAKALLKEYKRAVLAGEELDEDAVLELGGSTNDKEHLKSYGYELDANGQVELGKIAGKAYNQVNKTDIKKKEYSLTSSRFTDHLKSFQSKFNVVVLEEVAKIERGSTITKKKATPGDIPVIAGGMSYSYTHNESNRKQNIITVSASGANAGYIWFHDYPIFASDCTTIKPIETNQLNIKFLYYLLKSKQNYFFSLQHGGAQPHVYGKDFKNIKIPLPTISIQKEIVAELDRYQKIIDGAKQVVDNYQPSFVIEDDWEWFELEEIADFRYGFTASAKDKGDARFIRITDIGEGGLLSSNDKKYISLNDGASDYVLEKGDLLVARTGATFGKTLLFDSDEVSVFASYLIQIMPSNKLLPRFYWAFAQTAGYWNQANKLVSGGAQPQFNANVIKKLRTPVPPLKDQKRIVKLVEMELKQVDTVRRIIQNFENKIDAKISSIWNLK